MEITRRQHAARAAHPRGHWGEGGLGGYLKRLLVRTPATRPSTRPRENSKWDHKSHPLFGDPTCGDSAGADSQERTPSWFPIMSPAWHALIEIELVTLFRRVF